VNKNATTGERGVLKLDVPLARTHATAPLAWHRRYPHVDGFTGDGVHTRHLGAPLRIRRSVRSVLSTDRGLEPPRRARRLRGRGIDDLRSLRHYSAFIAPAAAQLVGELAIESRVDARLDPRPHERVERPRHCHQDARDDSPPVANRKSSPKKHAAD
jgi:hypothetical protein